ncbi:hypothetical protein LAZ67_17002858, partial [Cordylochernes scorpioides]
MTSSIFQEWLLQFNKQIVSEGRRILLLLDNAMSHCVPNDGLSNIKIHFLPPNMTASLQPLDSGIIKSFKAQYRKFQLQKMVKLADAHPPTELRLDYAVRYCKMAWDSVSPDSISNCWNHTGIIRFSSTAAVEPLNYGNLLDRIRDIFAITPENLMTEREFQLVDDSQEAEMKLTDDNFLVSTVTAKKELGEDDDATVTQRLPSLREARTAAEKVLLFLEHSKRATSDDVNLSADLLRRVYAISEGEKTQVVITDFFKKMIYRDNLFTFSYLVFFNKGHCNIFQSYCLNPDIYVKRYNFLKNFRVSSLLLSINIIISTKKKEDMMSINKPSGVKRYRSEMDSDPKHFDFKFGQISCAFNTGVNQINTLATKAKLNEDLRRSLIKTLHSALTCAELALQDAYTGINLAQSRPKPMAETPSRPSYAETANMTKPPAPVSSKVKPTYNNQARDFESHVVIKSINPTKESREILREVKSKNPSLFASNEVAASVKGKGKLVIHTKTKHVAVELASKLNNAMPSELSCQERPTIHPRYCIFGVEDSTKNEEILKSLENNPSFKNLPGKRHFRIAHRPKPNPKGYTTVFVEVDDDAAKTLQQRGKIPIASLIHRYEKSYSLKQCYRCCVLHANLRKSPDAVLELSQMAIKTQADVILLQELPRNFRWPNSTFLMFAPPGNYIPSGLVIRASLHPVQVDSSDPNITAAMIWLGKQALLVCSAYWHHDTTEYDFLPTLESIITTCAIPSVLGMDANAHSPTWGLGAVRDARGASLEASSMLTNLHFLGAPVQYTWSNGHQSSSIDVTLASSSLAARATRTCLPEMAFTDHLPILTTIQDTISPAQNTSWAESTCVESAFTAFLGSSLQHAASRLHAASTHQDIDDVVHILTKILQEACNISMKRKKKDNRPSKPWWNKDLAKLRNVVVSLRRLSQCTSTPIRNFFKGLYRACHNRLRAEIRRAKHLSWINLCQEVSSAAWSSVHKYISKGRSTQRGPPLLKKSDGTPYTPEETCEKILQHFCLPDTPISQPRPLIQFSGLIEPDFTDAEVLRAIKCCGLKKSPGPDRLGAKCLQLGVPPLHKLLAGLFTKCLRFGHFPSPWKIGLLVLIPKPDSTAENPLERFRPIALLNTLAKVFERCILARLQWLADRHNWFSPLQFGFVPCRSAENALAAINQFIDRDMEEGEKTLVISLDIRRAFDTVHRYSIIEALREVSCPEELLQLITSYLVNRKMAYSVWGHTAHILSLRGVPQGAALSPFLFNMIARKAFTLQKPRKSELVGFADDFTLMVQVAPKLPKCQINNFLENFSQWCRRHGMLVNPHKTQACMFYSNKPRWPNKDSIRLLDQPIAINKTIKILGITFDSKRQFIKHLNNSLLKYRWILPRLTSAIKGQFGSTFSSGHKIYKRVVLPALLYGSEYVENTSKAPLKRPRVTSPEAIKDSHATQNIAWCPKQTSRVPTNSKPTSKNKQPEKPQAKENTDMEIEVTPNRNSNPEQNPKKSNPPNKDTENPDKGPNNPTPNPKIRIPPIKISGVTEWSGLREGLINCTQKKPEFSTSGRHINVQTHSVTDYRTATRWLEERHYTFHFKILDEEKNLRIVVRGLDCCITIPEIQEDLDNKGFHMTKIVRLRRAGTKEELPLIQVTLPKTPKNKDIYNITDICDMKCRVEAYRAPKGPGQCHRCQSFGHSKFECRETPKCVKCGENHFTSECSKQKEVLPKCANCQGQHTANWRGCPLYKKINKDIPSQKNPRPNALKEPSKVPINPKIPQTTGNKEKTCANQPKNIALISETWLKPCHRMNIPNYNTVRNDRMSGQGGGTAIFIHRKYYCVPIQSTCLNLETTGITIKDKNGTTLNIYSCYKPPNTPLDPKDIYNIFKTNTPTILAGDLNCKNPTWGSFSTNPNGKILQKVVECLNLDLSYPDEPTHDSPPDILDIAIHKNLSQTVHSKVLHEMTSDHLPVLLILQDYNITRSDTTIKIIDWALFKYQMENTQPPAHTAETPQEIIDSIASIEDQIIQNLQKSTKYKELDLDRKYPAHIKEKLRKTNRLRKKMKKTCDPNDKKAYISARRESQKLTREHDNTSWDTYIENLDVSDQTVWKAIRRLTAPKKEEIIVKTNNNLTLTAEEAAEALADSYEKQLSPNPPTSSYSNNYLNKRITAHLQTNNKTALEPTNIGEIKAIIDTFPKKKAPGIDGITNEALKLLPNHILESLTSTFNASLKLAYFPNNWKTSIICPILKQGKSKYDPASYRPISLLPVTSKLFERIILRRIKKALSDEHPLRPEQFGFQQKHSTLHQLVVVTEKIRKAMESKQLTGGIFFDISKAFDKVWHEALLYKMAKKNLPGDIIRMTKSFLCDRNLRVKVKDVLSTPRKIRAGVPQGSVIGPTFFNIFIDDYPCPDGMSLHLYADDAATLVSAFNLDTIYLKLQEALVFVNIWCDEWRVELNPQKTEAILFSDKRLKVKKPLEDLGYPDEPIKWKDSVRYLGVILDQHLTFQEHVQNRINLAKAAQHRLALFLGNKSKLSLHCKRTIYTSIIRPILTYGHPVFITANKTTLKKFESFENQVLKKIIGAPWTTKRVTQCFNCQGFGHGQLNCFLKSKCVKCAEEHHSKDCPRKSKQLPPKCANCGEAHTANYRGCPNFPKPQQQQLKPPRQNSPNNIPQASSTKTEEATVEKQKASYAETAKKKTTRSDTRELCENLRSLRLRGDNRFLRPPDLLAPERWLQATVGDFSDGAPALARSTRAALLDAQHLGAFFQRLLRENASSSYDAEYEAETIVLRGSATPITRLPSQRARRALDLARLQAHPTAELAARWTPTVDVPRSIPWADLRRNCFSGHDADVALRLALHALPHPDHPASRRANCAACGSSDGSLAHRYWSCRAVRTLLREVFASCDLPLDLQAWLFGVGLHPEAVKLTSVAKATIYKYHLGLELGTLVTPGMGTSAQDQHLQELLERAIARWSPFVRGLSLAGRAKAANSLVLSAIYYHLQAYLPSETTIGRLQARLARFVWGHDRTSWLPSSILARPISVGGMGLLDVGTQLRLSCLKGVQAALRGGRNAHSWLAESGMWLTPASTPGIWLPPRRRRSLHLFEPAAEILDLNHRILQPALLRALRVVGDCRFLRPPELLAPTRRLGWRIGELTGPAPNITIATRGALTDVAALGSFCTRLITQNARGRYRVDSLADAIVVRGTTTAFQRLTTRTARRLLERPRLAALPITQLFGRWFPTSASPSPSAGLPSGVAPSRGTLLTLPCGWPCTPFPIQHIRLQPGSPASPVGPETCHWPTATGPAVGSGLSSWRPSPSSNGLLTCKAGSSGMTWRTTPWPSWRPPRPASTSTSWAWRCGESKKTPSLSGGEPCQGGGASLAPKII